MLQNNSIKHLLILGFIFIWGTCFSQVNITGTVFDNNDNTPLPGANIFLISDWSIGTSTGGNGTFNLTIPNSYMQDSIIISFIGYQEQKIALNKSKTNYKIQLIPASHDIDETVIIGRRIASEEFSIKQAKQLDIYLDPGSKADPLLAVNSMPASTTADESASVSLRGSRPEETTIFFNEVPIYDAVRFSQLNGIGTFSIFNTAIVDRMLVYPSNPPLEYGNSTSGLISIQSHGQILEGRMSNISLGLANIGGLHSQNMGEKHGITVFGNYQPSEVLSNLNENAFDEIQDFYSGDLGIHYIFNNQNNFKIKFFNYTNLEGYDYKYKIPSYDGIFEMDKKRNFSILNFSQKLKDSELSLNTGASFSSEKYIYSITDISLDKNDYYASLNYFKALRKFTIKLGASYDGRFQNTKGTKPIFDYAQDEMHPSVSFASKTSYEIFELSGYLKYYITDKLISSIGLRKNIPTNDMPDYLSYQGHLAYNFVDKNSIKFSIGEYNKMAMPYSGTYDVEHFNSKQIAADYSYEGKVLNINMAAFYKEAKFNESEEEIFGVELYGKVIKKKFELQASYTFIDAKQKSNNSDYPSPYDFDYFIKATGKYKFRNNFEVSMIYSFRQGQYYNPVISASYVPDLGVYQPIESTWDQALRYPDFHKIDISISKLFTLSRNLGITAFASINNVLGTKNVRNINYYNDYSSSYYDLYSKRSIYFGCVIFI